MLGWVGVAQQREAGWLVTCRPSAAALRSAHRAAGAGATSCMAPSSSARQVAPPFVVESDDRQCLLDNADLVLDQQIQQLFAIDQANVRLVGCSSFGLGASREVARGDDDALLVHLQRAAAAR